jgi:hypothetical protein
MRDVNYMCEAVTRYSQSWWTINGGYCLPYSLAYQTLGLDTTVHISKCRFALKCALSDGLDQNCTCKNVSACRIMVNTLCAPSNLPYPGSGFLLAPYVRMVYTRERDWTRKKPDILSYEGRVKCMGYQFVTDGSWWKQFNEIFPLYDYRILENILCNMREGFEGNRNYSGPSYDMHCWNASKTFNNRSYQVSFLCETRCISKYRVRDGVRDCYQTDEVFTIHNSCPQIQRYRLQCSPSELSCLLASTLGNWGGSCFSGRDEFDYNSGTVLRGNIDCTHRNDPGCMYLRDYIRASSYDNTNRTTISDDSIDNDHSTAPISFRSYCNSFFDTKSGIDESPQFCQMWACSIDKYRCLSGQCIPQLWVCDGSFTLLVVLILIVILFLSFQVNGTVVTDQMNNVFLLWMISMNIIHY